MGSPGAGKATTVTIRFLDDEIMEGRVGAISLDRPNIEMEMSDQASNNERALIPLPSIKRITLSAGAPTPQEQARAERKVAIRFQDGEVLLGYLDGELQHASHGVTMRLMTVEKDRIETLGIPYTALKALFYLKTWDTRPPEFDGEEDRHLSKRLSSPLVDLISDMGQLDKLRKRGAITESEFQRKRRKILDNI
ncbi:MAG: SHOCT domain-containing protein [Chloroflexi bacterium]|nr:MAG: SHOCT domain-containing protein [Chloroflexota bacterium]TME55823.1 MAG: SHOCT domain-containing protein [Chloroflexota bacterium]